MTFDEPVVQVSVLAELADMFGDGGGEIVLDIINAYLDETPDLVGRLRVAISDGNADGVREAAHALKSSSANVGAMQFGEYAKVLESAGREGDLTTIAALGGQLDEISSAALTQLGAWDPASVG